jgi:hypothetical protein
MCSGGETCMLQADPALLGTTFARAFGVQAFICLGAKDGAARALAMVMHDSQQIASEHRDLAAHAHLTGAEHHGKQDHLTGHESSRQALEHSNKAYLHPLQEHQKAGAERGINGIAHEAKEQDIAALAYRLWQARCCPEGSPEEDWFRAAEQLRSRH